MPRTQRQIYTANLFGRDDVLEKILRRSLLEERMTTTQIDDVGARILQLLILVAQPMQVIELGTYFGYSSIFIGRGLPENGRLTTLETDPKVARIAQRNIDEAGLSDRVDVVTQDGIDYLESRVDHSIDVVFIDGSKDLYPSYLRAAFPKIRGGGLLIIDDALCWMDEDKVFTPTECAGIDSLNRALVRNDSVWSVLIESENGLMVSVKR